jgi:RNA polymerase sigma-70 factor (ECF subfamily)
MPVAELTDAELAERCLARDEDAVRELTRRNNQRLYRIARSIVRDDQEAEDVVQETYVRALTGLETFRGQAALGTWLVRIAMNEALGRVRRRRSVQYVDDSTLETTHAAVDPIDDLPDAFRSVFVARMVEGLSVEETAELFALRPETVRTRVHRARVRLRTRLEAQVGPSVRDAFAFDGERCNRLTNAVLHRLRELS